MTLNLRPASHPTPTDLRAELQRIFGYSDFRPPQAEIVQCLLNQQDALILMPTGGGKSICFQLPALLQPGLTIVISPLIALMENQVHELQQRQIPAALIYADLPRSQRHQILTHLDQYKLLYLSPETLLNRKVWQRLCHPNLEISSLILDEAHCLALWGDTFRPAYYRLGEVRSALLQHKPAGKRMAIAAFTATADPQTQQIIEQTLCLQSPQLFRRSPYRDNLHLAIQTVWTPRQRRQRLLRFVRSRASQSGLVYVRTRRDSEELAVWLTQQGFRTAAYHAGLPASDRRRIEQAWLTGTIAFVICTSAFGMGINKSAVRWVVHFHAPLLLAEYVQEVGRAGRDGKPATALMLVSEPTGWLDREDRQRWRFFEEQGRSQQQLAQQIATQIPPRGDVETVTRQFQQGDFALAWLYRIGRLTWETPFEYVLHSKPPVQTCAQTNRFAVQQMPAYLRTRGCRWQFILDAFGFSESGKFRCGHCDNCRSTAKSNL